MVHQRLPGVETDVSILKDNLNFRNGKQAKNRFMKPPMTERICTWDLDVSKRGYPTERIINMYEKWGNGGFGLIFSGNVSVDPFNLEGAGNAIICKENDSAELRQLLSRWAKAIKSDGSLAVMQISHAGRMTPVTIYKTPFSASDVQVMWKKRGTGFGKPIPIALEQIQTEVIDRFVFAAKVAYETGFDGVQVHTAHGCLLSQFLSPSTNLRTDRYGGSVENRARVVLEIMDAIRKEIPREDFLMGVKINSADFEESEFENAKTICQLMEEKVVDFVELTGGSMEKGEESELSESTKQREVLFQRFANIIRPIFKDSVIYSTGGFRTAAGMVSAVKNGETHGVGVARPSTAEPDFPRKILSGEVSSAVDSKLNAAEDFFLTIIGSQAQMALMGRHSLAESNNNDVCSDIPDFSDPKEAEHFKKAVAVYGKYMDDCAENDEPVVGTLEYTPL